MQTSNLDAFVFSAKAAVAAVAAWLCITAFHLPGAIWAAISAVIVTQPTLHPSYTASIQRVAANLIGAFIGAAAFVSTGNSVVAMAIAVSLTGLACHFARLQDATRPAFAAAVIVTLSNEPHVWIGSLDRVFGVSLGCAVALVVGMAFDRISRAFSNEPPEESKKSGQPE